MIYPSIKKVDNYMKTISFDIDGVVADGRYIEIPERNTEAYLDLDLVEPCVPDVLNRLARQYNIYFLTARSYPNACRDLRMWLHSKGVDMARIAGTICAGSSDVQPIDKVSIVQHLKSIHVDDDPEIIEAIGPDGILFKNPYRIYEGPVMGMCHSWGSISRIFGISENLSTTSGVPWR